MAELPEKLVELDHNDAVLQDLRYHEMLIKATEVAKKLRAIPQFESWRLTTLNGDFRSMMRYVYRPLSESNEIRLLRVYKAQNDVGVVDRDRTILRGHIFHTTPMAADSFCAISY